MLPWLIAWLVRALAMSWRVHRVDGHLLRDALDRGPVVVAFFHEDQLPLVALHRGLGLTGMASASRDGALLAGVITRLGYGVVRGSSSRGGVRAALRSIKGALADGGGLAIAVDGPRGPRRRAQPGAVTLAAMAACPMVLLSARAEPAWRAASWDRFLLPLPFARVELRHAALPAPPAGRGAREELTAELEARLRALAGEDVGAEALAASPPR